MSEFIEECRREWKRLHVPDPMANEMAADLASDLAEAESEGTSPEELLGNAASDPQAFARSWAQERGLVARHPSERRRLWVAIAVLAVAVVIGGGITAVLLLTRAPSQGGTNVVVPNLVGVRVAKATAAAMGSGLSWTIRYSSRVSGRSGFVVAQTPSPGTSVPAGGRLALVARR